MKIAVDSSQPYTAFHLGKRRSITWGEVKIDGIILRVLYRYGRMTPGQLRGRVPNASAEEVESRIKQLMDENLIEFQPPVYGNAGRYCLTKLGEGWGLELVSARQIAGSAGDLESQKPE